MTNKLSLFVLLVASCTSLYGQEDDRRSCVEHQEIARELLRSYSAVLVERIENRKSTDDFLEAAEEVDTAWKQANKTCFKEKKKRDNILRMLVARVCVREPSDEICRSQFWHESAVEEAVVRINRAEPALYQDPENETLLQAVLSDVAPDSPKWEDVMDLVNRAKKRGDRVMPSAKHEVDVLRVTIQGLRALVVTSENSFWIWDKGGGDNYFSQTDRAHTYYLEYQEGRWKVKDEKY